ncbi:cytochrome aa3 quinol oxidase subunit III [Gracilibacillus sp. S3-1-1]|uniref:Cytochrome aa3 quinol oxidase subunit III n=1 Tax=Gracilibacillus pellucidus TaxID=3095368 RepID=A0ACC6M452_9BACI|nr:cytochrome aa3 quinol oxidase subunit III [Gracilibacillus sp. S3-1-1]MDX8045676.1 cytochrome aa3 quinol oxidase subunit III [Gracilibacillus sp. S3-1-1]
MTSQSTPLEYQSQQTRMNILGFWTFLGAEIVLFSTLFASYFILEHNTAGGPTGQDVFVLKDVLIETFLLLTSSFTSGLAIHALRNNDLKGVLIWKIITLVLGASFLAYEINEFFHYVHEGVTMQTSGFASALFTLLGTHGAHVTFGIIWIALLLVQVARRGITVQTSSKLFIASLYWHFLDVVWIFIFTFVYLKGMVM